MINTFFNEASLRSFWNEATAHTEVFESAWDSHLFPKHNPLLHFSALSFQDPFLITLNIVVKVISSNRNHLLVVVFDLFPYYHLKQKKSCVPNPECIRRATSLSD